jgi:hypothetical protein
MRLAASRMAACWVADLVRLGGLDDLEAYIRSDRVLPIAKEFLSALRPRSEVDARQKP